MESKTNKSSENSPFTGINLKLLQQAGHTTVYASEPNRAMLLINETTNQKTIKTTPKNKIMETKATTKAKIKELLSSMSEAERQEIINFLTPEIEVKAEAKPEPIKPQSAKVEIVNYSDKSFAVIGETKELKNEFKKLGGRYNPFLSCGKGWIFGLKKIDAVKSLIK